MSNRLINERSPYLKQHAENPVNWYPWCDEAFEKAAAEDKPIFLSIGYSTCHWCHVMARESFENEKIAEILNRSFISIKVDREERPDIDSVYMSVCQTMTGSGGWPMSVFMTPDKKPLFAGTYFPPEAEYGTVGFSDLLLAIERQWQSGRDELMRSADSIVSHLKTQRAYTEPHDPEMQAATTLAWLRDTFDSRYGGFGPPPKFPMPHCLWFLLMQAHIIKENPTMVEKTLKSMANGGIFDHIGGGFFRYSTDRYYLVPHFEKMLYDNALLIITYCAAYRVTGHGEYLSIAVKCADFVLSEMADGRGGFYTALDADSDGAEGKYYTFTNDEIKNILGTERGAEFCGAFDITESGNFDGKNIPNLIKSGADSQSFAEELNILRKYRKGRTKLNIDDKIVTSSNAMMIAALCMLHRAARDEKYLMAAVKAQSFIDEAMADGALLYATDSKSHSAFLDDYAFEIAALIELYNSTLDALYLGKAETPCDEAVRRFHDDDGGGFFQSDGGELFMNVKETYDGAVPSGNSMMAYNFARLYELTDDEKYRILADEQFEFLSASAGDVPIGGTMYLFAKLMYDNPPQHITFVTNDPSDLDKMRGALPFFANVRFTLESDKYPLLNDRATFYICNGRQCLPPTNEPYDDFMTFITV